MDTFLLIEQVQVVNAHSLCTKPHKRDQDTFTEPLSIIDIHVDHGQISNSLSPIQKIVNKYLD